MMKISNGNAMPLLLMNDVDDRGLCVIAMREMERRKGHGTRGGGV
jgi:hypothetical protein